MPHPQILFSRAAVMCVCVAAACSPGSATDESVRDSRGEVTTAASAIGDFCLTSRPYAPDPGATLEDVSKVRGLSCYRKGGTTLLFYRKPEEGCSADPAFGRTSTITEEAADQEFQSCSGLAKSSAIGKTNVLIVYPVENATPQQIDDFVRFGTDLIGLTMFDGLPVTHLLSMGTAVCMETDRPDDLFAHIAASNIVDGPSVRTAELSDASCRAEMQRMLGYPWPEVSSSQGAVDELIGRWSQVPPG